MSEKNTVSVKIYGQEYSISGEMSREYIMKLSDYVDGKMRETGGGSNIPVSAVAVLTAVNMADDYFTLQSDVSDMIDENARLRQDTQKYIDLWEEVKRSFAQYKDDMNSAVTERNSLREGSAAKDRQLAEMFGEITELKKHNEVLRTRITELTEQAQTAQAAPAEAQRKIAELEAKCRETESSFFDIQMENIHLKNEIDTLRKQIGR